MKRRARGRAESRAESSRATEQATVLIGPPKLTRFERARIVGARSLQISMGAPVLMDVPEGLTNPIEIALMELRERALPLSIRRTLPDGSVQNIPLRILNPEE